jgi:hypothetical protein
MNRPGVQVAEAVEKSGAAGRVWEALLFNNTATCARKLRASAGSWALDYPDVMPPQSLLRVSATLPPGVPAAAVQLGYEATSCTGETPSAQAITGQRLVIGGSGGVPRFGSPPCATPARWINDARRTSILATVRSPRTRRRCSASGRTWDLLGRGSCRPWASLQGLASLATVKVRRDGSLWQAVVPCGTRARRCSASCTSRSGSRPRTADRALRDDLDRSRVAVAGPVGNTLGPADAAGRVNPRALRIQSARIGPARPARRGEDQGSRV